MGFHECSKGWDLRCMTAAGQRCTCRCGGVNHGKLRGQPLPPKRPRRRKRWVTGELFPEAGAPVAEPMQWPALETV